MFPAMRKTPSKTILEVEYFKSMIYQILLLKVNSAFAIWSCHI